MKKILLVGNGAREHVIAETLKKSKHEVEIYVVGKARNPGLAEYSTEYMIAEVTDLEAIREFALDVKPDFAVMGPEAPIAAGVVDMLLEIEIPSASPLETVGRLETSKAFTRDLLMKYDIPGNPKFKVFFEEDGIEEFFEDLGDDFVVKADGLKGGKGVKVSGDHLEGKSDGIKFAKECLVDAGRVVVEEKIVGQEFSLMCFSDGKTVVPMPIAQDHKRAYDNDEGPNTGGMGSYSDANHILPFLRDDDLTQALKITQKVAEALFKETGALFKGIMYGGFFATKNGVKLVEYNARFGDPEVMNVLPLLKTDFVDICEAIIAGSLDKIDIEFEKKATVCKYVVPEGYPENSAKNKKIEIEDGDNNALMYFSSVDGREDGLYLSGSRAIAFVGIADTLLEAEKIAQSALITVKGPVFYRNDIGKTEVIEKKIQFMDKLRG